MGNASSCLLIDGKMRGNFYGWENSSWQIQGGEEIEIEFDYNVNMDDWMLWILQLLRWIDKNLMIFDVSQWIWG